MTFTKTSDLNFGGAYETRSDGSIFKYYSFGGQSIVNEYDPVAQTWELSYLLTDHLGSVVAVTNASGALISQQRYLPFGGTRQLANQTTIQQTDYGYTGQRNLDADIGLMDYKARFYSPVLNRFIQPDTLVPSPSNPQAWNRFTYVYNNPIRYVDPSGNIVESPWDVFSLVVGVASLGYNLSQGNYADVAFDVAGLAVDTAALLIPGVPGGASVAIKAYRAVDATVEGVEAVVKYGDDVVAAATKVLTEATQNADSPIAVLGTTLDKYYELANSTGATHLFSDSATAFYKKYGEEAFWELINKPFVQQEIIDKGKTVLLATPYDTIINKIPDIYLTRREINLLDNARYTRIKTPIGDALVHAPY